MSKTKKVILIVVAAVFLLLAAGSIFFFTSLNTLHFEYNDVRGFSVFSPDEADAAQENESFDIGYPEFTASAIRRMTRYNLDEALAVYSVINDNTVNYLTELAERCSNRVNLNYSVVIENDTLTISFFGTAYPGGNDAGVDINKVFEYSIKNASAQNPPVLCAETPVYPEYPDFIDGSLPSYTNTTDPDLAGFVPLAAQANDNSLEESKQIENDDTFYPPEWRTRVYWTVSDEDTIYNTAEPPEYPEYNELYGEQ